MTGRSEASGSITATAVGRQPDRLRGERFVRSLLLEELPRTECEAPPRHAGARPEPVVRAERRWLAVVAEPDLVEFVLQDPEPAGGDLPAHHVERVGVEPGLSAATCPRRGAGPAPPGRARRRSPRGRPPDGRGVHPRCRRACRRRGSAWPDPATGNAPRPWGFPHIPAPGDAAPHTAAPGERQPTTTRRMPDR